MAQGRGGARTRRAPAVDPTDGAARSEVTAMDASTTIPKARTTQARLRSAVHAMRRSDGAVRSGAMAGKLAEKHEVSSTSLLVLQVRTAVQTAVAEIMKCFCTRLVNPAPPVQ